ncbi:MAG: flagellar basal body-associated FliL family protein [Planctomycetota bacterium]|nr:flagellar basal body-associated FliL family protein [Planctomycetota bacterium]MDA1211086.1 flagellar basal body-associated FliL family protein [Planctomycetota bacterium]
MSTVVAEESLPGADSEPAPAKRGLLKNTKVLIAIAIGALMVGEAAVLYIVLGPEQDATTVTPVVETETTPAESSVSAGGNQRETEIGSFNCTNNQAAPGSILHISFRLAVTIPESDRDAFDTAVELHKHRINEAVTVVFRRSTLEDLNDADLQTIKRRIQESINKVVSKSYVKDVIITEFRSLEQ